MWKYVGPGWLPGVPARDLTEDEAKKHNVEKSSIYEKINQPADLEAKGVKKT